MRKRQSHEGKNDANKRRVKNVLWHTNVKYDNVILKLFRVTALLQASCYDKFTATGGAI